MSSLHLDSLEIKNFRCFEHLVIEKLGRVNLIVGKNSVGKTALLEGLWLLAAHTDFQKVVQTILYTRNELVTYRAPGSIPAPYASELECQEQAEAFRKLFFGRPKKVTQPIEIITNHRLSLGLDEWGGETQQRYTKLCPVKIIDGQSAVHYNWLPLPEKGHIEQQIIALSIERRFVFRPVTGLSWQALSAYWDTVALTDSENNVIDSLNAVIEGVERFTFKGEHQPDKIRYPVVRVFGEEEPLPLASLGEGAGRALGLALALVNCSNGFLFVDEFDTGLHHSVQTQIWRLIFRTAAELNVQVFATTHSWDCVEAFQEAAAEDQNEEAMLIRLQKKRDGSGIEAVLYDERRLTIATEENIEVR